MTASHGTSDIVQDSERAAPIVRNHMLQGTSDIMQESQRRTYVIQKTASRGTSDIIKDSERAANVVQNYVSHGTNDIKQESQRRTHVIQKNKTKQNKTKKASRGTSDIIQNRGSQMASSIVTLRPKRKCKTGTKYACNHNENAKYCAAFRQFLCHRLFLVR